jgi:hypothetical protein
MINLKKYAGGLKWISKDLMPPSQMVKHDLRNDFNDQILLQSKQKAQTSAKHIASQ